jgi:hypothetical protein
VGSGLGTGKKIKRLLDGPLKDFFVHSVGMRSVDAAKPGIDKALGILKLREATTTRPRRTML